MTVDLITVDGIMDHSIEIEITIDNKLISWGLAKWEGSGF